MIKLEILIIFLATDDLTIILKYINTYFKAWSVYQIMPRFCAIKEFKDSNRNRNGLTNILASLFNKSERKYNLHFGNTIPRRTIFFSRTNTVHCKLSLNFKLNKSPGAAPFAIDNYTRKTETIWQYGSGFCHMVQMFHESWKSGHDCRRSAADKHIENCQTSNKYFCYLKIENKVSYWKST